MSNLPEQVSTVQGNRENMSQEASSVPPQPGTAGRRLFRLQGKSFFFTWPQCGVGKESCMQGIQSYFGEHLSYAIVCSESHTNGDPHLHAIIRCRHRIDRSDMQSLDAITGKHGNYQTTRSIPKVVKYVCKGGDYITIGDVSVDDMLKRSGGGVTDEVIGAIRNGSTLKRLREEYGNFYLHHAKKIEYFHQAVMMDNIVKEPWSEFIQKVTGDHEITKWLKRNICQPRQIRQKQLYIFGEPGIGKTKLVGILEKYLRIYHIPRTEDFYDAYEDGRYDLCVLDEFKAHKTVQWLNNFLDGSKMQLRKKGAQVLKEENLPVIILSNFSLEGCFHKKDPHSIEMQALTDRLEMVNLESYNADAIMAFQVMLEEYMLHGKPAAAGEEQSSIAGGNDLTHEQIEQLL